MIDPRRGVARFAGGGIAGIIRAGVKSRTISHPAGSRNMRDPGPHMITPATI
jgi:hypothetical protein